MLHPFLNAAQSLHLSTVGKTRKPYKPLLLLALLRQFEADEAVSEHIVLDTQLVAQFNTVAQLTLREPPVRPFMRDTVAMPYRHLATDFAGTGIWEFVAVAGKQDVLKAARSGPHRLKELMGLIEAVRLDPELVRELADAQAVRHDAMRKILSAYPDLFRDDAAERLLGTPSNPTPLDKLTPAKFSEAALEASLIREWSETPWAGDGIALNHDWGRHNQVQAGTGRIDILGYQASRPAWWVFELKLGRPSDAVVGQTLRYVDWIDQRTRGRDGETQGAIVARDSDANLRHAVRGTKRLSLWLYDDELNLERVGLG